MSHEVSLIVQLWRDNINMYVSDGGGADFDKTQLKYQILYKDTLLLNVILWRVLSCKIMI